MARVLGLHVFLLFFPPFFVFVVAESLVVHYVYTASDFRPGRHYKCYLPLAILPIFCSFGLYYLSPDSVQPQNWTGIANDQLIHRLFWIFALGMYLVWPLILEINYLIPLSSSVGLRVFSLFNII